MESFLRLIPHILTLSDIPDSKEEFCSFASEQMPLTSSIAPLCTCSFTYLLAIIDSFQVDWLLAVIIQLQILPVCHTVFQNTWKDALFPRVPSKGSLKSDRPSEVDLKVF